MWSVVCRTSTTPTPVNTLYAWHLMQASRVHHYAPITLAHASVTTLLRFSSPPHFPPSSHPPTSNTGTSPPPQPHHHPSTSTMRRLSDLVNPVSVCLRLNERGVREGGGCSGVKRHCAAGPQFWYLPVCVTTRGAQGREQVQRRLESTNVIPETRGGSVRAACVHLGGKQQTCCLPHSRLI